MMETRFEDPVCGDLLELLICQAKQLAAIAAHMQNARLAREDLAWRTASDMVCLIQQTAKSLRIGPSAPETITEGCQWGHCRRCGAQLVEENLCYQCGTDPQPRTRQDVAEDDRGA